MLFGLQEDEERVKKRVKLVPPVQFVKLRAKLVDRVKKRAKLDVAITSIPQSPSAVGLPQAQPQPWSTLIPPQIPPQSSMASEPHTPSQAGAGFPQPHRPGDGSPHPQP
jgi:hypothetical protein